MKRFPDNPSAEDRRTYRRWVGGLLLFYSTAFVVAIGVTVMNRPASDLTASNETRSARLMPMTGSISVSPSVRLVPEP